MNERKRETERSPDRCLSIDDLYHFSASSRGEDCRPDIEAHLSRCPRCQEELAEVLKLLHPDEENESEVVLPPSDVEISRTLELIQDIAQKEERKMHRPKWIGWAAAAAAAMVLVGAGAGLLQYQYLSKSKQYFNLAKANLEEIYSAESPGGLRMNLPFRSAAPRRSSDISSPLDLAENLFFQALGARETMPEAHLGLASVYMSKSQFAKARDEFQKVLDASENQPQALLGRGIAEYEEARQADDPVRRHALFGAALADFGTVVRLLPDSNEAHYNRIWVLYETGRHKEALAGIGSYLSRDANSIWAARLRDLQSRIRLLQPNAVNGEVERAARGRDAVALESISRMIPERIPAAIRLVLKKSLQEVNGQAASESPRPADLKWAAETMEGAYSTATGDHSWKALLTFYGGLSPAQKRMKRSLDDRFEKLVGLQNSRQTALALSESESLKPAFATLQDYWQLVNIHHLRGNCFYYQADFRRAEIEYLEMQRLADVTGAPELRAKALAALTTAYLGQDKFDDAEACMTALRQVADQYNLDSWRAYAAETRGLLHLRMNQFEESVRNYSIALRIAYRNHNEAKIEGVLENLLLLMDHLGRSEDAKNLCAEAADWMATFEKDAGQAQETEVIASRLNLLCKQGELALRMGDLDRAGLLFKQALTVQPGEMRELECRIRLGLAQVYVESRNFPEAKLHLEKGLVLAASGHYEELEWQASYLQGKMHRENGDVPAALAAFKQSVDILERMRGGIASGDLRRQFLVRRFDPFKEIVSLLCRDLRDGPGALDFVDRAKSLSLREYLDGPPRDSTQAKDIPKALRALSIDYFFAADRLFAFVSGPSRSAVTELPFPRPEAERDVTMFLESIRNGDQAAFNILARSLYDKLVEPVLASNGVESCENLVIFPDGPLYLLPFGGLRNSRGNYLLESYTLSYAPSRSVLGRCLSLERGAASSRTREVLLLDGTANLPGAGNELAGLSRLYGNGARLLTARDVDSAGRLAAGAEIIHFAGHATRVNGKSALVMKPGPRPVFLNSEDIDAWKLHKSRLVTLAGCETGIGPLADGGIPWGLLPAFLNAGAPALVVSLLPADDASTATLVSRFYDLLAGGAHSKASALRQAQLHLLHSARTAGRLDPASWLPYVLVGDPR